MGYDGWPDAPAAQEATSWELGENTRAEHLPAPAAAAQPPFSTGLEDGEDIIADAHLALDSLRQEGKA